MHSFSFSEKVITKKLKFLEFNSLSISAVLERFHFFQFHPIFTSYAVECLLIHAKNIFKRIYLILLVCIIFTSTVHIFQNTVISFGIKYIVYDFIDPMFGVIITSRRYDSAKMRSSWSTLHFTWHMQSVFKRTSCFCIMFNLALSKAAVRKCSRE